VVGREEICFTRDAASSLEYGDRSIKIPLDEEAVAQAEAGRGQAVRAADAVGVRYRSAAGVDALLELPELREAARARRG
jgi:hypothetical protein